MALTPEEEGMTGKQGDRTQADWDRQIFQQAIKQAKRDSTIADKAYTQARQRFRKTPQSEAFVNWAFQAEHKLLWWLAILVALLSASGVAIAGLFVWREAIAANRALDAEQQRQIQQALSDLSQKQNELNQQQAQLQQQQQTVEPVSQTYQPVRPELTGETPIPTDDPELWECRVQNWMAYHFPRVEMPCGGI